MARIGDFADRIAPLAPDTPGAVAFERFQTEPNTLALAVVDAEGRPLGLIERNAFTLKMAAEFGRALYAGRPVETLHVLVADDHAANRFVVGKLLETFGCTAEMVENGEQAVEAARDRSFDLVLMDIKMPVMDGVEATRRIRALPGPAARLPILALTANADERDARDYLAAGMDGVTQKPIQPDALLNAIRRAMAGEDARQAAA